MAEVRKLRLLDKIAELHGVNIVYREALEWIAANEPDPLDANRLAQLEAMIRRARAALREEA